jgi:hypothetical protein
MTSMAASEILVGSSRRKSWGARGAKESLICVLGLCENCASTSRVGVPRRLWILEI